MLDPFELQIRNFKSVRNATLPLQLGLNILVGPNGAGKTCVLGALTFIRNLLRQGVSRAMAKSGGAQSVYRRGSTSLQFLLKMDYGVRTYNKRPCRHFAEWHILIRQRGKDNSSVVARESFRLVAEPEGSEKTVFAIQRNSPDAKRLRPSAFSDRLSGWNLMSDLAEITNASKPSAFNEFRKSVSHLLSQARVNADRSILPIVATIDNRLAQQFTRLISLSEYNILPEAARQSSDTLPYAYMSSDGTGVAEVVHALESGQWGRIGRPDDEVIMGGNRYFWERNRYHNRHWYFDSWRHSSMTDLRDSSDKPLVRINMELAAAVSYIQKVSVALDPTNGKRFVIFHSKNGNVFFPREVSDGTLKWLCILISIFVPLTTLYLLEEPENFLHPWMQQKLVELMRQSGQAVSSPGMIYLLTSHSATLLNAALPSEILVISPSASGTRINRVSSNEQLAKLLRNANFRLGDFWVSGGIGGVPTNA